MSADTKIAALAWVLAFIPHMSCSVRKCQPYNITRFIAHLFVAWGIQHPWYNSSSGVTNLIEHELNMLFILALASYICIHIFP